MTVRLEWPNDSRSLAVTTETELIHVYSTPSAGKRGMNFMIYSDTIAGTATVKYIEPGGTARVLGTATVPAGGTDVTVLDFDFSVPEAKLYMTLDSASASTITSEAVVY